MNTIQLIEKIISSRLTPTECAELIKFAEQLKENRPQPTDIPSVD